MGELPKATTEIDGVDLDRLVAILRYHIQPWDIQTHEALNAVEQEAHALRERVAELEREAEMTGDEGPLTWQVTRGSGLMARRPDKVYRVARYGGLQSDDPRFQLHDGGAILQLFPTQRLAKIAAQKDAFAKQRTAALKDGEG